MNKSKIVDNRSRAEVRACDLSVGDTFVMGSPSMKKEVLRLSRVNNNTLACEARALRDGALWAVPGSAIVFPVNVEVHIVD